MRLYFFCIGGTSSQTLQWVFVQKTAAQVASGRRQKVILEIRFLILDILVELFTVFIVERRQTNQHFIDNSTERPPVSRLAVALPLKDFRTQVFCGAAQTICVLSSLNVFFAEAEICESNVAVRANQHVLWLQISVENILVVEMLERQQNVSSIEASSVLLKSPDLGQVKEKFATWAILQSEE